MKKLTFNQLSPGMMIEDGLLVHIGKPGSSKIFGKSAFLRVFRCDDAYYGQVSFEVKRAKKYRIIEQVGSEAYRDIIQKIIEQRVDCASKAESDIDLLWAYKALSS